MFNTKIEEWAEWTESLEVELLTYWKFDESSGTDVEDYTGKWDLTTNTTNWTNGLLENGLGFNGTDFQVAYNDTFLDFETTDLSFNIWIKTDKSWNDTRSLGFFVMSKYDENVVDTLGLYFYNSWTSLIWQASEEACGFDMPIQNFEGGTWYMYTIVRDFANTNLSLFRDGVVIGSDTTCSNAMGTTSQNFDFNVGYGLKASMDSANYTLDEVGSWLRPLTEAEIIQLYNGGTGITPPPKDELPPNVTINTPTNTTYSSASIVFNATALDETSMTEGGCWASIDAGVTNLTLLNTTTKDDYNATNTTVPDGEYQAQFWCNDTGNNVNNTETKSFTVNTPPTIPTLLGPENATGSAMNSTITFVWSNSTDVSDETITYDLEIYNHSDMGAENLTHSNTSITEGVVNTSINIKLSDYTTVDGDYYWRVRANDSVRASDWSPNWTFQYANWTIVFNLTDSFSGEQLDTSNPQDDFGISCDNGFSVIDVKNPYNGTDSFAPGTWECIFSSIEVPLKEYNDKTQEIVVNKDETIEITVSQKAYLTEEEHTWLEWLYTCWNGGDCWDLLNNINTTTTQTWQRLTGTDTSVITQEDVISSNLNSTSNITMNYTIDIPYKAGVAVNELLPIRLYFWFTDVGRTTCYNQDKATDTNRVEDPYCLPLVAEILGPNNGSKTFTVDLRPNLVDGTYNFTRSIEIDPLGVWTQYGREDIGQIEVQEGGDASIDISNENNQNQLIDYSGSDSSSTDSGSGGSSSRKTTIIREREIITFVPQDSEDNTEEIINLNKPGITGATIGSLLTSGNLMFIIAMICITFIVFLVVTSKTILHISKNK